MGCWNKTPRLLLLSLHNQQQFRCVSAKLVEVGRFEIPKTQGKYEAGQLFLHKVFGYQGVILFPWVARLFDRDLNSKSKDPLFVDDIPLTSADVTNNKDNDNNNSDDNELHFSVLTYYQALIDQRDWHHIRAQPKAVTILGRVKDYSLPGLDYVCHDDVLPYVSTSRNQPIEHELFDMFLTPDHTKVSQLTASDSLHRWHNENHKWLELSDVHRETTEGIRVTVIPFYMGVKTSEENESFWWRYCIRLENLTQETFHLRERHWRVFSSSGTLNTVHDRGVEWGGEIILSPEQSAFQYSSHVSLRAPSGHMWGTYTMERNDGSKFEIQIPPFSLESKDD